jgi:hypothetical protein
MGLEPEFRLSGNLVHTKARRHEGLRTINDPFATFLKAGGTEIDEKTQWKIEQSKIGENLLGVNQRQGFNGFQFNQNKSTHNQVGPKSRCYRKAQSTTTAEISSLSLRGFVASWLRGFVASWLRGFV